MPVHNGADYIEEAVDSLLGQSFVDYELIISDNASTDETGSICRDYAARDPRIRYVRQSDNRGPTANFQYVLDEAIGEYFMWAAADDVWDRVWVESLFHVSSSFHCVAFGVVQVIDGHGCRRRHPANGRRLEFIGHRFFRRVKYFLDPAFLGKANPIYGIYPTSFLKEFGISWIDSEGYAGDMMFLYDLLDCMEVRHTPGVCIYKRIENQRDGIDAIGKAPSCGSLEKLLAFMGRAVRIPMVGRYMRRSGAGECVALAALYPTCVVLVGGYATAEKLRRVVRSD
jgi:glycosyltransferase involved in cell wall biosynthesis